MRKPGRKDDEKEPAEELDTRLLEFAARIDKSFTETGRVAADMRRLAQQMRADREDRARRGLCT